MRSSLKISDFLESPTQLYFDRQKDKVIKREKVNRQTFFYTVADKSEAEPYDLLGRMRKELLRLESLKVGILEIRKENVLILNESDFASCLGTFGIFEIFQ